VVCAAWAVARGVRPAGSGETMKKKHRKGQEANSIEMDEILPEYDFSRARPNKYASRYTAGSIAVVLDPDVAAVFPSAREANAALRALAEIIQIHRLPRAATRRT